MRISDWSSDVCSSDLQFTEIRRSGNRREARRGDWVHDLAEYLRKRARDRLPDGQRLEVTITDITRAGNYEPWRGISADSIRFMRDIYPPRITRDFTPVRPRGTLPRPEAGSKPGRGR